MSDPAPTRADSPAVSIALWGNFGTLNLGNECTLAAVIQNLRRRLPGVRLVCVCPNPADASPRQGVPAISIGLPSAGSGTRGGRLGRVATLLWREMRDWGRAYRTMRTFGALVVVGTGILTDDGEGTLGLPYQLFKWVWATRLARGRVAFLSVGVEKVSTRVGRATIVSAMRAAAYRSYRDELSRLRAQALGVPVGTDSVYPDLAFSLPEASLAGDPPTDDMAVIGVGIYNYLGRGDAGSGAKAAYLRYVGILCDFIERRLAEGRKIRLLIGDYAYDELVRLDFVAELKKRGHSIDGDRIDAVPAQSFETVIGQIATTDAVIASRFHNVVLSLLMARPVLSLSYDRKNDVLMEAMGLGAYCQELDDLDPERLERQFVDLLSNASGVPARLRERSDAYRRDLDEQYARVLGAVCE